MSERCNERIYNHGKQYGIYEGTHEWAEKWCKQLTKENEGQSFDWFWAAGRVVVKFIDDNYQTRDELIEQNTALKADNQDRKELINQILTCINDGDTITTAMLEDWGQDEYHINHRPKS